MSHWRTRFNTERPQKGWERALTEYTIRSGIKLMKGMAVQSQPQPTRWNCSPVTLFLSPWTRSFPGLSENLNLHHALDLFLNNKGMSTLFSTHGKMENLLETSSFMHSFQDLYKSLARVKLSANLSITTHHITNIPTTSSQLQTNVQNNDQVQHQRPLYLLQG